jgi:WD40 repeat protein
MGGQEAAAGTCPDCGTDLGSDLGTEGLCPRCLLSLALAEPALDAGSDGDGDAPTLERPAAGRILGGRYQMRELLGRGGMGEVWRAFDLKLRVDVALKSVRSERVGSDRGHEVLRQEVRSAREVVSPNVCRIFDLVEEEGREFVSMEYVDGMTLAGALRERGPLELSDAREIASQFLSGLEAIHHAGLVHRDFKPENVMITRAGRVVVMDFGLARGRTETGTGTISGTPPYMAPEQARGDTLDARADVFAAGVVLAEMLSVGGDGLQARQALWRAVRETPPRVPEGPWASVLRQALDPRPEGRPASARALAHALEEVTLRLPGFEDKHPYPGLMSFTEEDAEYFFGREAEVEAVWKKLKRPRLLALIGPSGAGKSSFIRAGLLAALPRSWAAVVATPGHRPFESLARELVPAFSGDTEAMQELLRFGESDTAVELVTRWRRRHEHALVVVDQFEELFTLSPPETQARFAELLGRLVLEADVHVLLAMRDDFLLRCQVHSSLAPAFSDLTPLGALSEGGLRRALVQPALACGYRFEDESLVEEMVGEVSRERGALPLLAFAASRLWDKRDRERGLLTREAYEEIGGVAGALAQHAEATLERIGPHRAPLVRELFRNLVTSQGTRAARERRELLSVFRGAETEATGLVGAAAGPVSPAKTGAPKGSDPAGPRRPPPAAAASARPGSGGSESTTGSVPAWSREEAAEVLDSLIDARLLTSYERVGDEAGESRQEIEIVHESLLVNWPRLVRWQTQDADGAQLRDQLRQAAQAWQDRGKPEDQLWSGTAYRDFAVWRERYPGGLTATEDAFAQAMETNATRRRRRRRAAVAALVGAAAVVAIVTSALWQRAEAEVRQREAAEILALGRVRLEGHPTAALAHAIASLERADSKPARRFAVEVLWKGPTAFVVTDPILPIVPGWSSDGRWLALQGPAGLVLRDRVNGTRHQLGSEWEGVRGFSADGSRLVTEFKSGLHVWALPEMKLVDSWPDARIGSTWVGLRGRRLMSIQFDEKEQGGRSAVVRERSIDGGPERTLGRWVFRGLQDYDVDPRGEWLASVEEGRVLRRHLKALEGPARLIGRQEGEVTLRVMPRADRIVTADAAGEVRVWSADEGRLERMLLSPANAREVALDPSGRYLATAPREDGGGAALPPGSFRLFDLEAPRGADPAPLLDDELNWLNAMAFDPHGDWLASSHTGTVLLWSLAGKRSLVFRGQKGPGIAVAFTPDGRLVSTSDEGVVRLWPFLADPQSEARELWSRRGTERLGSNPPRVSPDGRLAVVLNPHPPASVIDLPLDGSPAVAHALGGAGAVGALYPTLDPAGRRVAVMSYEFGHPDAGSIRILDLATGKERALRVDDQSGACRAKLEAFGPSETPLWLLDGRLVSEGYTGLRLWDLSDASSRQLRPCRPEMDAAYAQLLATPDSRTVVSLFSSEAQGVNSALSILDLETGATRDITSHGTEVRSAALDPPGAILVTGGDDGLVRVGPLAGGEPHLLFGHTRAVWSVAVSPDGKWIASASDDGTIRLWPMPEGPPLHTLPYEELLAKLRSLTNLRVVPDRTSATGYGLEPGPVPNWAAAPEW